MKEKNRKIKDSWQAYWFLHDHPKLNAQFRQGVTPKEANELEKKGFLITRDPCGKCYRVLRHHFECALDSNLDIFYAKVDKHGVVNKNKKKNVRIECWLEFGPLQYGFVYSGTDKPQFKEDDTTMLHHVHDPRLDTGGSTFDEGLVLLAKNVLKYYGDYGKEPPCNKSQCADCKEVKAMLKRFKSATKEIKEKARNG
jgi:hypothetical protein